MPQLHACAERRASRCTWLALAFACFMLGCPSGLLQCFVPMSKRRPDPAHCTGHAWQALHRICTCVVHACRSVHSRSLAQYGWTVQAHCSTSPLPSRHVYLRTENDSQQSGVEPRASPGCCQLTSEVGVCYRYTTAACGWKGSSLRISSQSGPTPPRSAASLLVNSAPAG